MPQGDSVSRRFRTPVWCESCDVGWVKTNVRAARRNPREILCVLPYYPDDAGVFDAGDHRRGPNLIRPDPCETDLVVLNGTMTDTFSSAEREEFRRLLVADRDSDLANATAAGRNMRLIAEAREGASTDDEHDPEGVTLAFERSQESAMVQRSERGAAEASAALTRLEDGSYGLCASCGGAIAVARLRARPATTLCIECARNLDP